MYYLVKKTPNNTMWGLTPLYRCLPLRRAVNLSSEGITKHDEFWMNLF